MNPATVLLTGSGSPGTAALVRALRENGEREFRVVGVDMSERSVGRHLCDAFRVIVPSGDPLFVPSLLEIVEQEDVDVVLPQTSFDLPPLAEARDEFPVPVLVSSPETVRRSNDKAETYSLLRYLGVTAPDFRRARGGDEVRGCGARARLPRTRCRREADLLVGVARLQDPVRGRRPARAAAHEPPGVAEALRLEELVELLGDDETELLVMELAEGGERTIDGIADGKHVVLGHPKTREAMRAGLAMHFVTLADER